MRPTNRWLKTTLTGSICGLGATANAAVPTRDWGTYVPDESGQVDFAQAVVVDAEGNAYVAGGTGSTAGIATPGAPRATAEQREGFLMKFAPDGALLWGTYIGGSGDDSALELALAGDTLLVTGATDSPGLATVGAFDTLDPEPTKPVRVVLAMKTDGQLLWTTYLRSATALPALDANSGAAYVAGSVSATVPGLAKAGSHKPSTNSSSSAHDGFLARLGAAGELVWGTYYGGQGLEGDDIYGVLVDPGGDVYIAGQSECQEGIATLGTHKESNPTSGNDAFLARFTPDGKRVWGTYYGGDFGFDGADALAQLPGGDLVIAGTTTSETGVATPGAFQEAYTDDFEVFVARFTPTGQLVWGTYYGAPGYDSNARLATSPQGQIYLEFHTESFGLATDDAYQPTHGGDLDLLLAKFDPDGARLWATYVGGAGKERFHAVAAPNVDALFLVGDTTSPTAIATPGALDDTFEGDLLGPPDAFVARFSQGLGAACDGPGACPTGFCVDGVCCESECGGGADDCQACAAALGATEDGACTRLGPDVVCRPGDACDPAETCDGQTLDCPADVTTPAGDPCDGGVCMADVCVPDDPTGGTSDGAASSSTGEPATGDGASGTAGAEGSTEGCACASDHERGGLAMFALLGLLARRRPRARARVGARATPDGNAGRCWAQPNGTGVRGP